MDVDRGGAVLRILLRPPTGTPTVKARSRYGVGHEDVDRHSFQAILVHPRGDLARWQYPVQAVAHLMSAADLQGWALPKDYGTWRLKLEVPTADGGERERLCDGFERRECLEKIVALLRLAADRGITGGIRGEDEPDGTH